MVDSLPDLVLIVGDLALYRPRRSRRIVIGPFQSGNHLVCPLFFFFFSFIFEGFSTGDEARTKWDKLFNINNLN
jgi:hypothetical protein